MPATDNRGYNRFPNVPVLRSYANPIIDGVQLAASIYPFSSVCPPPGAVITVSDGTQILQWLYLNAKAPVSVVPLEVPLAIQLHTEADFLHVMGIATSGVPVSFFCSWPHIETWLVTVDPDGLTWRSSRRTAWNGTTITHATHPPQAWLDGVEQTIVTTGTPVAGEVKVPTSQDSGQGYFTVTTPDLTGSAILRVLYWPEYFVRFEECTVAIQQTNDMTINATLKELVPAKPAN